MRYRFLLSLMITLLFVSCRRDKETYAIISPPPPPPVEIPKVKLKDVVIPNMPSPFYHFEYDTAGKPIFASYASDLTRYDFIYDGNRLKEMRNNIFVNKDTLRHFYDGEGRVVAVNYINEARQIYTRVTFTYNGQQLVSLERQRDPGTGLATDKTMVFSYHPDGNLKEVVEHRPPFNGQPELHFTDRYEQYDNKVNVDGFRLLHKDFFDHLVFLPGVRLQKNNPGKLIHTGSGVNYEINYRYAYNDKNLPLHANGLGTWLNGSNQGETFMSDVTFSYY